MPDDQFITKPDNSTNLTNQSTEPHISEPSPPQAVVNQPPPQANQPAQKPKKSRKWLIFLLILIVIIAAAAAYLLLKNNKTTTTTTQATVTKRDIPLVRYAVNDDSDLTPNEPLTSLSSTDLFMIENQLAEGLVGFHNLTNFVPVLATSWTNPNDTTWVFNLRQGVKFHSGRTLTATDVKYSLDYAVAHQADQNSSTQAVYASSIKDVSIINPYKIQITTNGPDATMLGQLCNLFIIDSKASVTDPNAGTGPYTLDTTKTAQTSGHVIYLDAFNSYWGGHVYTRELDVSEYSSKDDIANALLQDKIDFGGPLQGAQVDTINTKAQANKITPHIFKILEQGNHYVQINTAKTSSPLSNVNARKAIEYALNVNQILKVSGIDGIPVNQLIPSALPGYDPSITSYFFDQAKAKQLLANVPNLKDQLIFEYPGGDDLQANEIAAELNAVGFNVKATAINDFNKLISDISNASADLYYIGYTSGVIDGTDIINNVVGTTPNYNNPQLADLITKANQTFNPSDRIKIMQQMEQIIANDVPVVPVFTQNYVYATNKSYVYRVDIPGSEAGIKFWQVYQK